MTAFSYNEHIDDARIKDLDRRVVEALVPGGIAEITAAHAELAMSRAEAERLAGAVEKEILDFNLHELAFYILVSKYNYLKAAAWYLAALEKIKTEGRTAPEEEGDPFGLGDLI